MTRQALTRRSLAAFVPAAVVAATVPAGATANPDFALLPLRAKWLAARAAYEAENHPHTPEYAAVLASLPGFDGIEDRDEIRRIMRIRCSVLDQFPPPPELSPEAEARQQAASDAEEAVIEEIIDTPARTLAGLAFKAEVSRVEEHLRPSMISSIMADIFAMGGLDA